MKIIIISWFPFLPTYSSALETIPMPIGCNLQELQFLKHIYSGKNSYCVDKFFSQACFSFVKSLNFVNSNFSIYLRMIFQ